MHWNFAQLATAFYQIDCIFAVKSCRCTLRGGEVFNATLGFRERSCFIIVGSAECALANFLRKTVRGVFAARFHNPHTAETGLQKPN